MAVGQKRQQSCAVTGCRRAVSKTTSAGGRYLRLPRERPRECFITRPPSSLDAQDSGSASTSVIFTKGKWNIVVAWKGLEQNWDWTVRWTILNDAVIPQWIGMWWDSFQSWLGSSNTCCNTTRSSFEKNTTSISYPLPFDTYCKPKNCVRFL